MLTLEEIGKRLEPPFPRGYNWQRLATGVPVSLNPGTRLGPYEITSAIGAGGMGEVYRAKDGRLNREVAIKVLPTAVALDPARQQRFLEEARAASALTHPNILAVYDFGTELAVAFMVSELVDGVPLRKRMLQGPLPVRELLHLAVQIADGLAAAHDAGIVHRDLKPENVMVTRDGRVKILDFGLAKVRDPVNGSTAIAGVPTCGMGVQGTQTHTGLIVGTVPYMSPEQARGAAVDFRSDQFSFGLMLYELSTGVPAFEGDTAALTLSAIIDDEPRPISEINPKVPAPLRWIVDRCLAKDPRQRYAATIDLAHDLRTVRDRLSEATGVIVDSGALRRRRMQTAAIIAVAALALTGVAVGSLAFIQPDAVDLSTYRFTPLANDPGYQGSPAWSPDGKTITYIAEKDGIVQVFSRSLGSSSRAQVTHALFDCRDPFWSSDGSHIFYTSLARDKEAIWSVSAAGGAPEVVMENATEAAISPDGKTLAFFREEFSAGSFFQTLWLSSPPGAKPIRYAKPPFASKAYAHGLAHFSPDGTKLGIWTELWGADSTGGNSREFRVIPFPGGDPYVVLQSMTNVWNGIAHFSWLPDNRHIVIAAVDGRTPGTHLWLADTEGRGTRPLMVSNADENFPSVSPAGDKIAYTDAAADFDLIEVPVDGAPARVLLATSRNEMDPAWSPAGGGLAFVTDRTGSQQIWLRSSEGSWERPVVTEKDFGGWTRLFGAPAFSPDGQRIAYLRFGDDGNKIWISTIAGGPPVRLAAAKTRQDAPTWSPDGNWIAYVQGTAGHWALAKARVGGGAEPVVIMDDVPVSARPQWSATGEWIACDTAEGLAVVAPDGKNAHVVSEQTWLAYGWARDGSRLFGIRQSREGHSLILASLDIRTGKEKIITPNLGPVPVANQPVRGFSWISSQSFATSIVRVRSDIWLLEGFRAPVSFAGHFWPKRSGAP
jgi:serine/threonine protein kinase